MRNLFFAVLCLFLFGVGALFAAEVRARPADTLASGFTWELAGNPLTSTESGTRMAYLPLRRRSSGDKWDEGCVRKILLDGADPGEIVWQSETSLPRAVLRPVFENGSVAAGSAVLMADFDQEAASAAGLDEGSWASAARMMNGKAMGAPYPAAMALAGGVLYVLCDDGVLCALSVKTGAQLWSLILPQAFVRLSDSLAAERSALPWLCAGSLTAEDAGGRTLLWGTMGAGGRGIFCADVSDSTPSLLWAVDDDGSLGLGLTDAAPLVVSLDGTLTLIVPSGEGEDGAMLMFDALDGSLLGSAGASGGYELILSPVGLTDGGALASVVCCDSGGGVQSFARSGSSLAADFRIDLESICNLGGLEFSCSPVACSTSRGLWLAFVAESSAGLVVAAAPAGRKNLSWSEIPWRGGGYGWWTLCEGFYSPISILAYDGLLYLLGWEDGRKVLKIIDLTPGRLVASTLVDDSAEILSVSDGQAVLLGSDGTAVPVADVSESTGSVKKGILYTLAG